MNELRFRGADQYRVSGRTLGLMGGVLGVQLLITGARLGPVGVCWEVGILVPVIALGVLVAFRASTTVGPAGVTVSWLSGAGRSYPWHRIQWIDVRETPTQFGTSYITRIHLTDGKRRSLPGLQHSPLYPSPNFGANLQQLYDWWHAGTDPALRIQPAPKFRDRHPWAFVWLLAVPVTLVIVLIAAIAVAVTSPS